MIVTRGLTKRYGRTLAVDAVDLDVREGDRYGFLGPNGSGKTTVIRLLLGLVYATSGEIEIFGRPVPRRVAEVLPWVGALVEGPAAYPHLSGRTNLRLIDAAGPPLTGPPLAGPPLAGPPLTGPPLTNPTLTNPTLTNPTLTNPGGPGPAGTTRLGPVGRRRDRRHRIEEALERVGLAGIDHRPVRAYSLGMRQRLGLAAALLRRPRLLVLDEPTNGLDPRGIHEIRELLAELNAAGTTLFLSSHLLAEVEALCTRVGVLDRGRLVLQDDLAALRAATGRVIVDSPDPAAAAALLDGRVEERDGRRLVVRHPAPEELNAQLVAAGVPVAGITAEHRSLEQVVLSLTTTSADRVEVRPAARVTNRRAGPEDRPAGPADRPADPEDRPVRPIDQPSRLADRPARPADRLAAGPGSGDPAGGEAGQP